MKPIKPNFIKESLLCILLMIHFTSCEFNKENKEKPAKTNYPKASVNTDAVAALIKENLNSNGTIEFNQHDTLHSDTLIRNQMLRFYSDQQFSPVWINENGINLNADNFLKAIESVQFDGLNPADYNIFKNNPTYDKFKSSQSLSDADWVQFELGMTKSFFTVSHDLVMGRYYNLNKSNKNWKNINDSIFDEVDALKKSMVADNFEEVINFMRPKHPWYTKFREEYIRLENLKKEDGLETITGIKDSIAIGFQSPDIALLRKRLSKELNHPIDSASSICDEGLIELIKKYQFRNGLKTNGKLDTSTLKKLNVGIDNKQKTLAINMERMRWLRHDFKQPYIWADIPKMEVEYVENDSVQFNMRTVVGRPARNTMTLDTKLKDIVFSPPWVVPPTILREDVLPGLSRRGGGYLARKGLKAYDRRGRQVSGSGINASNYKNFSFSQAPGYRSSLGEVKFNMPNPWSIYMHDTPHREDFVKSFRAYSSGCVRVHKPKEFAAFLLRDSANYSYQKVDSICKLRKTIFVPMTRDINVHFVYLTTALDSTGNIMFLKDLYNWDNKIIGMN
jgi:murein L,D-transpeptidase YcbB/YkuD